MNLVDRGSPAGIRYVLYACTNEYTETMEGSPSKKRSLQAVQAQEEEEEEESFTPEVQVVESTNTSTRTSATSASAGTSGENDDFVQVCSPPPRKRIHETQTEAASPVDDDGLVVLSSNVVNPNVDYPHQRRNCGKFPFSTENAQQHCPNCYCQRCDVPVSACPSWSQHCLLAPIPKDTSISTGEVTVLNSPSEIAAMSASAAAFLRNRLGVHGRQRLGLAGYNSMLGDYNYNDVEEEDWGHANPFLSRTERESSRRGGRKNERPGSSKRITEVLAEKLNLMVKITDTNSNDEIIKQRMNDDKLLSSVLSNYFQGAPTPVTQNLKMEGDVGELRLHNSFFVEGIRIGWPFSTILTPQRQMAIHIVKALKRKLHVVLESPTGTGKSAAILCSVLAWQRYHAKCNQAKKQQRVEEMSEAIEEESSSPLASMFKKASFDIDTNEAVSGSEEKEDDRDVGAVVEPDIPTIIYCSRTHSQVAQMVSSLAKTPYRPRMTVLGSRERLCINRELKSKDGKGVSNAFLNQACRERKLETDSKRKDYHKHQNKDYDDDNPIPFPSRDEEVDGFEEDAGGENGDQGQPEGTPTGNDRTNPRRRNNKPTCPHYQQLTTFRAARAVKERFIKSAESINSCCKGGEETKLGVMDIEELVEFGKNPDRESGIALYREPANAGSFGITLETRRAGGCEVASLRSDGIAAKDGRIRTGDWIQAINGVSTKSWNLDQVKNRIVNLSKDPLILTVQRANAPVYEDEDENDEGVTYSDHALCPYYLSRALMPSANLIFARKSWYVGHLVAYSRFSRFSLIKTNPK